MLQDELSEQVAWDQPFLSLSVALELELELELELAEAV